MNRRPCEPSNDAPPSLLWRRSTHTTARAVIVSVELDLVSENLIVGSGDFKAAQTWIMALWRNRKTPIVDTNCFRFTLYGLSLVRSSSGYHCECGDAIPPRRDIVGFSLFAFYGRE